MHQKALSNPSDPGLDLLAPVKADAIITLRRAAAGRPFRPLLFLGRQRSGQTALLNDLAREAAGLGFAVSQLSIHASSDFARRLYSEIKAVLETLSRVDAARAQALGGLKDLKSVEAAFGLDLAGAGLDASPARSLEAFLPDLFEALGCAAEAAGTGWVLCFERFDRLAKGDLSALIAALHRISQTGLPVVLFGAGLPWLAGLAGDAKPYAERLFRFIDLDEIGPMEGRSS